MAGMETTALRDRLMDGLDRFASAMRAEVRRSVASRGLNPAQDAILRLLLARPAGLRCAFSPDTSASASRPSPIR
jgi:hypothetical protein